MVAFISSLFADSFFSKTGAVCVVIQESCCLLFRLIIFVYFFRWPTENISLSD
jgi:hypothetical protein